MLVTTYSRVVIHITGFSDTDNRLNQQIGFQLASSAESNFLVSAMHRVSSLKGHDLTPAQLAKPTAQLSGGVTQQFEIVMDGRLDAM